MIWSGDALSARVELVAMTDDGAEVALDIPCEAATLHLSAGGRSSLALVVAGIELEVVAEGKINSTTETQLRRLVHADRMRHGFIPGGGFDVSDTVRVPFRKRPGETVDIATPAEAAHGLVDWYACADCGASYSVPKREPPLKARCPRCP